MKILYGIQGTGNGHISRGRMMAKYFKEYNADVTYLFSGRPRSDYFDMEIFGDFLCYRGLTFVTKAGKIDYLRTIQNNGFLEFVNDLKKLDIEQYDIIISDFEPITAWAAKLNKKKHIGLGHQYAFGPNTPKKGFSILAHLIMRYFAPSKINIGLHWYPYQNNILPPILDTQLSKIPAEEKSILVYLPFEDQSSVTALLNKFPDYHFYQYSPDLKDQEQENISLRKTSLDSFRHQLRSATAILSNSGFTLLSEAIHLGIPLLVKPVKGQFEQQSNALALARLGYGKCTNELDYKVINSWLNKLPARSPKNFPNVAKSITKWILSGAENMDKLSEKLWEN